MKYDIEKAIFQNYGLFTEMGYEESEQRGYYTFTCGSGTFVAVMAKNNVSDDVWFYKLEKRWKFYDY